MRESKLPAANFAYAHRLGTGIYEISGRTVQVYSLPFERRLRERDDEHAGLVLTLPCAGIPTHHRYRCSRAHRAEG